MVEEQINIPLGQRPWYGDSQIQIEFPAKWDVEVCRMPGHDVEKITKAQIQAAFANPIGTPAISELARGKNDVAIIFDDLSRPTKAFELVPFVLKELKTAGIKDRSIRFVAASGAHGAMKLMDFEKKLGKAVVHKYDVFNHNPYDNCTYLGDTSRKTPVHINSEVASCDMKIAIGCIVPHPTAGFGGGAKIMIGISHVDTIYANHHNIGGRGAPTPDNPMGVLHPSLGLGKVEGNVLRVDLEEMARIARLDCIVNVIVNLKRQTTGLFVGDVVAAHRQGVKTARRAYATTSKGEFDVLVLNAYCKANEASVAFSESTKLLKKKGGAAVLICNTPEGQICHYTARSFGKQRGGRLWGPRRNFPPRVKRLIAVGPSFDRTALDMIGPVDAVSRVKSWDEALSILKKEYVGRPKVGVIPDATIQYFPHLE